MYPELELRVVTSGDKKCEICSCKNPIRSFEFKPHTYNYETLEMVASKPPSKVIPGYFVSTYCLNVSFPNDFIF